MRIHGVAMIECLNFEWGPAGEIDQPHISAPIEARDFGLLTPPHFSVPIGTRVFKGQQSDSPRFMRVSRTPETQ
jgi:hypothetical protein